MEEKAPVKKVFKKMPRKKVCAFCQEKVTKKTIDSIWKEH